MRSSSLQPFALKKRKVVSWLKPLVEQRRRNVQQAEKSELELDSCGEGEREISMLCLIPTFDEEDDEDDEEDDEEDDKVKVGIIRYRVRCFVVRSLLVSRLCLLPFGLCLGVD